MLHQTIQKRLDHFQITRSGKRRSKVLREFMKMKALHEGRQDKYIRILRLSHSVQTGHLLSLLFVVVTLWFFAAAILPPEMVPASLNFGLPPPPKWTAEVGFIISIFFTFMMFALTSIQTSAYYRTIFALDDFPNVSATDTRAQKLIKPTIQGLRQGRQMRGSFAPACRSELRYGGSPSTC